MPYPLSLKIHHLLNASRTNGPGLRAVVWTQGCSLGCPGCFNPETHDIKPGERVNIDVLASTLLDLAPGIEGITISGGEPFQQSPPLAELLRIVRRSSPLSVIVFSGYTLHELQKIPGASRIFASIDLLIAGRYEQASRLAAGLIGSTNKTLHFFTPRYTASDLESIPEAEVIINPGGDVFLSGIHPLAWQTEKRQLG
jgi:anaerobic ribonucleoside-triphosphate reductase activating protein